MGFGKILINNLDLVVGGIGAIGSHVAAKLCDADKIKFKNKEQKEIFLFWLGGSSALSGVLIGNGVARIIGGKLQTHLENKGQLLEVSPCNKMVAIGYKFPEYPASNIYGLFEKEKALKIANDIIETANEIV